MPFDMRRFLKVIEDLNLRDLPLSEWPLGWCGGQNFLSSLRLDCFLVSDDQEEFVSNLIQCVLSKLISNHSSIVLNGGEMRRDNFAFRFENMWLKLEGVSHIQQGTSGWL